MPLRFALIPEADELKRPLRSFPHHSHRVIYQVDEPAQTVSISARLSLGARAAATRRFGLNNRVAILLGSVLINKRVSCNAPIIAASFARPTSAKPSPYAVGPPPSAINPTNASLICATAPASSKSSPTAKSTRPIYDVLAQTKSEYCLQITGEVVARLEGKEPTPNCPQAKSKSA